MFANGRDQVFNGMLQSRFENIIEEVIKDAESSEFILQFSQLGQNFFHKLNQKASSCFNSSINVSLSLGNCLFNCSLNFLHSSFDNRLGKINLSINNSLQFVEEVQNVVLHFTRFNLGLEFIENVLDVLNNLHNIRNSHEFNIFTRDKFSNEISQVLLDGGDQVFDGLSKSRLQDIIQQVIKDAESSEFILQFSQLGQDFFHKLNQKAFSCFNSSLNVSFSLGNHLVNGSLNFLHSSFDNRLGKLNLGINNSLQFVEEVQNVALHFTRFDLGLEFIENVLNVLSNLHDIRHSHVFSRLQLVSKISKMLTNGMFQGGFEDIIEEVIKDAISSQFILQFIKFGHDLFQKLDKESLTLFNTSFSIGLGFGNHFINGSLDLNKSKLDDGFSNSHLGINNSLQFVEEVHNVCLHLTRFNLSLEFIENILEVLSNLHDIRNSHEFNIFARDKFSNEISQVLLDGRDQVFDGLAKSRLQDIIQQVIKNAESSDLVLQFSQFSHDLLQELNQKALSLLNSGINVSLSLGNHLLNGSINLLQSSFDNGLGKLNFGINNSLQFF